MKPIETATNEDIRRAYAISLQNLTTYEKVELRRLKAKEYRETVTLADIGVESISVGFDPRKPIEFAAFVKQVDLIWRGLPSIPLKLREWLGDWILQYENNSIEQYKQTAEQDVLKVHKNIMFMRCPEHGKPIFVSATGIDFGVTEMDYSACCCDSFRQQIMMENYVPGVDQLGTCHDD